MASPCLVFLNPQRMLQSTFFSFPCCWTSASRALTACPQLAIFGSVASLQSIFLLHLYKAFFVRQDAQMRNFCECNFLHCGIAVPQNSNVFWQILFVESCVLLTLHPVLLHPFLSNALVREFDEDLRNCKVIQRASKLRVAKNCSDIQHSVRFHG